MYVHTRMYIYAHTYIRIYANLYNVNILLLDDVLKVCVYLYLHTHTCLYIHTHTFTYIYLDIEICLLHLGCHFFNLKSQSMFNSSRSLLPRSVENRPRRLRLEIEIEWHSKCNRLYMYVWQTLCRFYMYVYICLGERRD